jgi:hypothetical protein
MQAMWRGSAALCKGKWKKWVSRTKEWLQCAAFTVKRARGLFPPLKTLKGSKGLRRTEIGQWKKASASDVGRTRGCPIARNARCLLAPLNGGSTFAANVKSIPAMI